MRKGQKHTEETLKKMSVIHRNITDETREKMSLSKTGVIPWNKDKDMSESSRRKMSESRMGKEPWNKGMTWNDETKQKISDTLKGRPLTDETKKKMSDTRKVLHSTGEYKKAQSERMKKLFIDRPELREKYINRIIKIQKPTKPELLLNKILDNLFPNEWKYVGNGKFWIDGKNPDFVNINGKKLIIELFGDYWHRNDNPQDRISIFKPYGYNTLVIWEKELKNMEEVMKKIITFEGGK